AVGYLLGTENGRQQRDKLVAKARRSGTTDDITEAAEEVAADVAEVVEAEVDNVEEAAENGAEDPAK
ncbi:MAG: hypothetical protein GY698_13635, partial [Actinomycetia bacterium]|nr:hypothetical protein [Actinomycetes bacterium]